MNMFIATNTSNVAGLELSMKAIQDAHERAHAQDIRTPFQPMRNISTGQIILFGLTACV